MKKFLDISQIGVVVALGAALSGCAGVTAASISATEQQFISDVQAGASAICGFLPTAESIASIFTASDPALAIAGTVAQDICSSLSAPAPAALAFKRKMGVSRLPVILVNGAPTVVHGSFINH
jgi:hypothetical protein